MKSLAEHESLAFETIGTMLPEDRVGGDYKVTDQEQEVMFLTA